MEWLGILEPVKEVTEWVNSFVVMEKKVPVDSSNAYSPGHSVQKKLQICLDPRDLNEALECEQYYTRSIKEILGKFHGMRWFTIADFQLKPNVKPTRHAPRHVPIHLQEAFHQEIQNLEWLGILEPVKEVTEWVNSFVVMEKKVPVDSSNAHSPGHSVQKKLQICLDPRDLNEALECEPYYTRSIKEILGKFHGMRWFTIADFNKGYWMVELHPESRKLTMMALDIGRFQ